MTLSVLNSPVASASELLEPSEDEEVQCPSAIFLTAGKNSFAEAPREDDNMDAEEI